MDAMTNAPEHCDQCGELTQVRLIECPKCLKRCCEDCIAGRNVACFVCEEEE